MLETLIQYGLTHNLITERDICAVRNQLASLLKISDPLEIQNPHQNQNIDAILAPLIQYAVEKGIIQSTHPDFADLLDSALMGVFCDKPSSIQNHFETLYQESQEKATSWFYQYCIDVNYIRINRIKKNIQWMSPTPYGELQITINLSKPEKDPLAIAAQKNQISTNYPLCLLCKENEGFSGTLSHPARQNLRLIELEMNHETWYLQYSPYIYYPEHSIVLSKTHKPMTINQDTFHNLITFLDQFPHYFIGSNADLPIVGGSILSHAHYQAGKHIFPIDHAKNLAVYTEDDISYSLVDWPLNIIRLSSKNSQLLIQKATSILEYWKNYSNHSIGIHAFSDNIPHNTITPIARKRNGIYELDLALRNNRTSEEHPLGIYHPHSERHHIKKENIGLIEVMGLAILPGRLIQELELIKEYILNKTSHPDIEKHMHWISKCQEKHCFTIENIDHILKNEVGLVFAEVLKDCGVFKELSHFKQFFESWQE